MYCPRCGTEASPGTSFCRKCGAPLAGETAEQSSHVEATPRREPSPTAKPSPPRHHRLRLALLIVVLIVVLAAAATGAYLGLRGPTGTETSGDPSQASWLEVVLEADSAGGPVTSDAMDQAVSIIQSRLKKLGVTESEVQRQGPWQISVKLPGTYDLTEALAVIGKTAMLEFFDANTQFGTPYASEADALEAAGVTSSDQLPEAVEMICWPMSAGNSSASWYLVTTPPLLTGAYLADAQQALDANDNPKVDMEFNDEGATILSEVTGRMAETAQITGVDQLLVIVLDGSVWSAPRVLEQIDGGMAEISGKFTLDEARNLALVLQTGALPVNLVTISQSQIPAP